MKANKTVRNSRSTRMVTAAIVCLAVLATSTAPVLAGEKDQPQRTEITIKLRSGSDVLSFANRNNLRVLDALLPSHGIYTVESIPGLKTKKPKDRAKELQKTAAVEWAEADSSGDDLEDDRFHAWPEGSPAETGFDPEPWTNQPNLAALQLDLVHRRTTGANTTVAVLDTGADLDHPYLVDHLAPETSKARHYDYVDDDPVPMEEANGVDDDQDGHIDESFGHGTHTAGIVALIAPDAELLIYRVLDSDGTGNPYVVAAAIDDAVAAGVDVINVSFGMAGKPESKVLKEAFKNAHKQNVIIVAAAGNSGDDGSRFPSEEKSIIGVAAMGNDNVRLARFSNYGKRAMVAAPGQDIVSTLPGGGFGAWSGTSMAAPIVAGQVALLRSNYSELETKKLVERVGKSARKVRGKRSVEKGLIDILKSVEDS